VAGRTLRRIEAGSGRPSVVLEAGRNDVAASWRPVMDLLAPYLHVVAYDRAGLGGSPPATDPVILARQLSDLRTVIAAATTGRCVLAGHSWGGVLVQLLAVQRPDLVAGLVLVDPADEQLADVLPWVIRRGARLGRLGRADERRGGDTAASLALLRELRRTQPPFPDVPVVVLSATRGFPRRFRARRTQRQASLAAAAPRGRHLVAHRAGHQLHRERPDLVAGVIRQVAAETSL
jgi:pimeloyl-ACP methyl ester carboxylesterase